MTPGRLYKREYARELVRIAEGDAGSAKTLAASSEGRPENACYHAAQAVEKALKAVLVHLGQPILHTHDLDALVGVLPTTVAPPHADALGALSQYSMVRRYEEGAEILQTGDLELAVQVAREVVAWAITVINA